MIRVAIFLLRELDRAAIAAIFSQQLGVDLVGSPKSELEAVCLCKNKRPDATILDASLPVQRAVPLAKMLLHNGFTGCVVLLGDAPDEEWVQEAAKLPNATYISREDSFDRLMRYIHLTCGFDRPLGRSREESMTQSAIDPVNSPAFSILSARERQVFRLLAEGKSVRQCARMLSLALSTVDNHKSRLMKKLNIHKSIDLVRLAIREGIVSP